MSTSMIPEQAWRFYGYTPSKVLPFVAIALFSIAFIGHVWLAIRRKTTYMIPFVLGVLFEVGGYAARSISVEKPTGRKIGLPPYLAQSLFIILAPALMAATFYMCFGRLITYVGQKYSPVKARFLTAIFVFFDVLSFIVQGAGGSLYSSDNIKLYPIAKTVLIIGFLIQIISFGIFGVVAVIYQIRAKRGGEPQGPWTKCLYTLYIGVVLILVRGIFRTIEFGTGTGGQTGYLLTHEVFYYVLEGLPILLCSYLFLISHPSKYIPSDRAIRLHPESTVVGSTTDVEGGSPIVSVGTPDSEKVVEK